MIEEKDEKIIELKKDVSMLRTVKDDEKENLNEINLADELKCLDIEKPKLSSTPVNFIFMYILEKKKSKK